MKDEIISSVWFGIKMPLLSMTQIGIVAVKMVNGKVKFYIGLGRGDEQKEDEVMVAEMGVPFYPALLLEWMRDVVLEPDRRKMFDEIMKALYDKAVERYQREKQSTDSNDLPEHMD